MADLLLDTHVFAWLLFAPEHLRERQLQQLSDRANTLWVSAASAYEIGNKVRIGKWQQMQPVVDDWQRYLSAVGASALPLTFADAQCSASLGWLHRDPIDRMLAAQALARNWALVSCDEAFAQLPHLRVL